MAVGARRLAQDGIIVAKLSAIEEMAGMTVLCCDKTGELTVELYSIQTRQLIVMLLPHRYIDDEPIANFGACTNCIGHPKRCPFHVSLVSWACLKLLRLLRSLCLCLPEQRCT